MYADAHGDLDAVPAGAAPVAVAAQAEPETEVDGEVVGDEPVVGEVERSEFVGREIGKLVAEVDLECAVAPAEAGGEGGLPALTEVERLTGLA